MKKQKAKIKVYGCSRSIKCVCASALMIVCESEGLTAEGGGTHIRLSTLELAPVLRSGSFLFDGRRVRARLAVLSVSRRSTSKISAARNPMKSSQLLFIPPQWVFFCEPQETQTPPCGGIYATFQGEPHIVAPTGQ